MREIIDHFGQTFGRWKVGSFSHSDKNGNRYWNCVCDCGTKKAILGGHLRGGKTRSCGCFNKELKTTHGLSNHPLFQTSKQMNERCNNPKHISYKYYGGRGIKVCDRWHSTNPESAKNFIFDMEPSHQKGSSLDRIDNNKGYSKENCRWSSKREQIINRRNTVIAHFFSFKGELITRRQLSKRTGIPGRTLSHFFLK